MEKRNALVFLIFSAIVNFGGLCAQPNTIPGLSVWYSSDNGVTLSGANVSNWADLSGNNNHAIQLDNTKQAVYVASVSILNNKPVIRFDGVDDFMSFNEESTIRSVFFVIKHATGNQDYTPIIGHPSSFNFLGGTQTDLFHPSFTLSDIINGSLYQNSILASPVLIQKPLAYSIISLVTTGNVTAQYITNDRNIAGRFWDGDYAEIIIYNSALTSAERQQVEQYLKDKYAPRVNLGADITVSNFCTNTLDASSRFVSYAWSTGASTQTISVNQSGTYSVTTTDVFGFTSSDAVNVTYPGNFTLFPGNATTICAGGSTTWNTNLSPASSYTFAWSTGATTSAITINSAGTYSVAVTDLLGCTRTSGTLTVTVDSYTVSLGPDLTMCAGNSILLTSGAGQAQIYAWSTGASTSSIVITSTDTYSVIVQNANGCSDQDTIGVTVLGTAPTVSFTVSTTCEGAPTQFTDMSSSGDFWNWDFGDASVDASIQHPLHLYPDSGTYMVSLTVTTAAGCSQTFSKNVKVYPMPLADFSSSIASVGANTTLTDQSNSFGYSPLGYSWNFDDPLSAVNNTSSIQSPIHQFSVSGTHNVKLIVQTPQGCIDSVIKPVFVYSVLPNSVPGLSLWYASDNGFTASKWNDVSGNNNHALQSTGANQPTLVPSVNLLNSKPVVRFDGVDDYMCFNEESTIRTVFFVVKHATGTQDFGSMLGHPSSYNFIGGTQTALFDPTNTSPNITTGGVYVNSVSIPPLTIEKPTAYSILSLVTSGNVTAQCITNERGIAGRFWNGDYAEIIVYNSALSTVDQQQVEQYLKDKYAPSVNIGANITVSNFCATTLDASPRFVSYVWSPGGATTQTISVSQSGTYSVTATDVFGFTSSDAVNVTYPGNFSPFSGNATTICPGSSTTWNTNLTPASSYTFAWSTGATTSAITINSAGTYSVLVTDQLGCTRSSSTVTVTVDNYPQTTSLGPPITACAGVSLSLASGAGQTTSYQWSTGATTSSIVLSTQGINTYSVLATNGNGCTATPSVTVNVKGYNPVPSFTTSPACLGSASTFVDGSTVIGPAVINGWNWNFGPSTSTSSVANPTHTYTASGSYTISLTVTTDSGCSASIQKVENVFAKPNAGFSVNTLTPDPCTGANVSFTDGSSIASGTLNGWSWNFGPSTGSGPVVSYTYTAAGTYTVTQIVTSGLGCTDTVIAPVTVLQSPGATFTADTVCKGNATSFTNTSTGVISGSLWNFGDGTPASSVPNPNHTYTLAGTHSASLVVTASNGCTGSASGAVKVNYLPVVSFTGDSICMNDSIALGDASTVTGSTVTGWHWQLGNGDTSIVQDPSASYSVAGNYSVTLTATSAQGCSASGTQTVAVMPFPVPGFSMSPTYSYPQSPVSFDDLSSGAVSLNWYFGDGTSTSSVPDPVHTYTATGTYTITLIAQSAFGCVDSFKHILSIDDPLLDIGIKSMLANNSSGVIQVSAYLENRGTLDVTTIELSAYLDNGTPVHEFLSQLVIPKDSVTYSFASSFELVNNKHSIVCVEVKKVNGQQDAVSSNNIQCVAITDEFTLLNPFPNPANEGINFLFVVPDAADVLAEVLDARGRVVATPYNGKASKGLNKVAYNTLKLEKGMYWVKLSYKDKVVTKPFIRE